MATQTVNFDDSQMQYILDTKDSEESFSNRVREIVDKGIEQERTEE